MLETIFRFLVSAFRRRTLAGWIDEAENISQGATLKHTSLNYITAWALLLDMVCLSARLINIQASNNHYSFVPPLTLSHRTLWRLHVLH